MAKICKLVGYKIIVDLVGIGQLLTFPPKTLTFQKLKPKPIPMIFNIKHAESLSRGELLLRTFFGVFYIYIPHGFVLIFMGLWGAILSFISFWIILFTGASPAQCVHSL